MIFGEELDLREFWIVQMKDNLLEYRDPGIIIIIMDLDQIYIYRTQNKTHREKRINREMGNCRRLKLWITEVSNVEVDRIEKIFKKIRLNIFKIW